MPQAKARTLKPQAQQPRPMTEQERAAAIARGFTQQYNSIAQGVLFNLVHGYASSGSVPKDGPLVEEVISITERYMEEIGPACDAAFDVIVNKVGDQPAKEAK